MQNGPALGPGTASTWDWVWVWQLGREGMTLKVSQPTSTGTAPRLQAFVLALGYFWVLTRKILP